MEYIDQVSKRFDSILENLKEEMLSIRTNRPSPKLIEDVRVNYMGQVVLIKQLGSISIELPRDLIINVWDQNAVSSMVNAIETASLGVTTSNQGRQVRVSLPQLTEERKRELIKMIKSMSEDGRIKMRVERDEAVNNIKELKDEDDRFRAKEKLQTLVDTFNSGIDELVERKTKDILE